MKKEIITMMLVVCFLQTGCTLNESEKSFRLPIEDSFLSSDHLEGSQSESDFKIIDDLIEYRGPVYYDARIDPNEIVLDYGDQKVKVPGFTRKDNISCVFVNEEIASVAWHSQYDSSDSIWVKTSKDQGATWALCEISPAGMEKIEHLYLSFDQEGEGFLVAECEGGDLHFLRTSDVGNSWNLDETISQPNTQLYGIAAYTNGVYLYGSDELWKLQDNGTWEKAIFPLISESYVDLKIDSIKSDGKIVLCVMKVRPNNKESWKDFYFVSEDNGQTWYQYVYGNTEN